MTKDRSILAVLFRVFGKMLITLVIIIAIPSAVPRFIGYDVYNIVSGSMEPGIPVGSAAYVKYQNPITVGEGQIIAFTSRDSIILHRVVENNTTTQLITTKGDANEGEDMWPVGYNEVVGVMAFSVPVIGSLMVIATSMMGKIYLMSILVAGVILQLIAGSIEGRKAKNSDSDSQNDIEKESNHGKLLGGLFVFFMTCFVAVIIVIVNIQLDYAKDRAVDTVASENYTITVEDNSESEKCPKEVDWKALHEINPEIIGWIYCEDTNVDFPICATDNNDYYLSHAYDRTEKRSGSIFLEKADKIDFSDTNSVIYGHNMKDGSMFHCLEEWQDQGYYDAHNYMWLLTPEKTYKVLLFSGYVTDAYSNTYTVFTDYGPLTENYINSVWINSDFTQVYEKCDILTQNDYSQKYVVLSTCAYNFKDARYVLHGKLVEQ